MYHVAMTYIDTSGIIAFGELSKILKELYKFDYVWEYKIEEKKTNPRAKKKNRVRGKQLTLDTLDPLTQTFVKKEFILHYIYVLGLSDISISIFSTCGISQQFDPTTIFLG